MNSIPMIRFCWSAEEVWWIFRTCAASGSWSVCLRNCPLKLWQAIYIPEQQSRPTIKITPSSKNVYPFYITRVRNVSAGVWWYLFSEHTIKKTWRPINNKIKNSRAPQWPASASLRPLRTLPGIAPFQKHPTHVGRVILDKSHSWRRRAPALRRGWPALAAQAA